MRQRVWWLCVLAAVLFGACLRIACLSAEFWLDEIWSWELAREAGSLPGVFLLRHDNNHHLNTLWLLVCPENTSWEAYRLHSLVAGLACIVLAAKLASRWGKAEAVFAAFLVAGSYWLVLSSAEARGYSLVVCFALLALDRFWSYMDSGSRLDLATFWLSAIGGFLSHLTFVHAYLGFVAWSMRKQSQAGASSGAQIRDLLRWHGVPGAFFVVFFLVSLRGMEIGGAPLNTPWPVLATLVSLGLGGPGPGWECLPWLACAVLLFAVGLWLLRRQGGLLWVFFAVAIVASPLLFLARRPPFVFERYFFIPFVYFLLLVALVLGWLWRQAHLAPRLVALVVLAGVLAGNAGEIRAFARNGRGDFHGALALILEQDPASLIRVTGDHDFGVRKYAEFHAREQQASERIVYVDQKDLPTGGADWYFVRRPNDLYPPETIEHDTRGNAYRLVRAYPSRGRNCWGWFLYRRESGRDTKIGASQPRTSALTHRGHHVRASDR